MGFIFGFLVMIILIFLAIVIFVAIVYGLTYILTRILAAFGRIVYIILQKENKLNNLYEKLDRYGF